MSPGSGQRRWPSAVAEIAQNPGSSALLFDIDGTLAPIVDRPELAAVEPEIAAGLERLAAKYQLVACITGRPAREARDLVGARDVEYVGLHGLELLAPGAEEPTVSSGALDEGDRIKAVSAAHAEEMEAAGLRVEDKHPITALHWRGASDEAKAAAVAREVARAAAEAGAAVKPGRKVIELRPDVGTDKGVAVARLVRKAGVDRALYAGDDSTDIDAFRMLGQMRVDRYLKRVVRVAVASAEEPSDLRARADVVVDGPDEVKQLIALLS